MSEAVLDASAVLALLFGEPGADRVADCLPGALISTVNLTEVLTRQLAAGVPEETAQKALEILQLTIELYDYEQALVSARLRSVTRAAGLSLGDRACLALAKTRSLPAVTADKAWLEAEVEVEVRFIR